MKYLSIILGCCLIINASAQMPNWKELSLDVNNEISGIALDSLGFLWFTSEENIYRYDGKDLELKLSLKDEFITSNYTKDGILYFGTAYGRVVEFNPYISSHEVIYSKVDYQSITGLHIIDDQRVILLSYGNGIDIILENKTFHLDSKNGLLSDEVYEVQAFNNSYYISTDQGIQVLGLTQDSFTLDKIDESKGLSDLVTTQLLVANDMLWYSDYDNHIGSIDKKGEVTNYKLNRKSKIKDIAYHLETLYVLTDNGLLSLDNGRWIEKYVNSNFNAGRLIQIDEEDNLWIVEDKSDLKAGNLRFQKLELDLDNIRALEKVGNKLYLGNAKGLYTKENDVLSKINDNNITYLEKYKDYLLVGTFSNGLMIYDNENALVAEKSKWADIPDQSILSICVVNDDIYVSSLSGVMRMRLRARKLMAEQSLTPIIGQAYIYCMTKKGNRLYFGTDRSGLVIWNTITDEIQKVDRFESGEKIGSVYSSTLDSESNFWFTSSKKGIGKLHRNKAEYLSQLDNFNDEFTSVANLKDGSLLFIRSASLVLLKPKGNHIMYLDSELGLKDEAAFLNTTTQDERNTYFAHDKFLYTYAPKVESKIHPEVIIDKVKVNLVDANERNKFEEEENNIAFSFIGSWLSDPEKITYQYKLIGLDDEWRKTKDNQVSFPLLRPGNYNFIVKAAENGMFSNEPEANYQFTIGRHFYNYWWVRLLLVGFVGFIIFRWRKTNEGRKKEKLALEKTIVENQLINLKNQLNPHFLFNAFNTLIGLIEEQESERSIAFVERMTTFYREMIEMGKDGMVSLERERNMLDQYIAILKERFIGQLNIESKYDDLHSYALPPMTLQLLIENAVKHNTVSTKKPLLIKITQEKNILKIWNKKSELVSNSSGTKTGLTNIKKRFELANLPIPIIRDTKEYFEVTLNLAKL